jgi:hypothetical protein
VCVLAARLDPQKGAKVSVSDCVSDSKLSVSDCVSQ